jgi:hypothetical protein
LYGISLNPKKWFFAASKGKILGHIVSKEGIYVDPERIKAINDMSPPTSKKVIQYLFGKIKFVQIFVPDYTTIVNPINILLKKDHKFEWTREIQAAFTRIKHAIIISPVLVSPKFDKKNYIEFIFFRRNCYFHINTSILTQRN